MNELSRIGVDTSKSWFALHGVNRAGEVVLRKNLRRGQLLALFRDLPPVEVALEACGGSHHWGRELRALGHEARLIPPQYVKPYVKRGKNDRIDAAAICEAAGRPGMHGVPIKSRQQQADALVLKLRDTLVEQRTQLINALRGHAAEFGLVAGKGTGKVAALRAAIAAAPDVPDIAKEMLALLGAQIDQLDEKIAALGAKLAAMHKATPLSRLLTTAPGIGPITALTAVLTVEPAAFDTGRHFAAWIGLTPKQHSTGGKPRLGGISRAGNERLRTLLVNGATAVIDAVLRRGSQLATPWLLKLLARKPKKLAAVALANKNARILWAMMTTGEAYRRPASVAPVAPVVS
ncbi:MAG TPA: IS110 family transposase [Acetobacteraceae bacterium]|nr:IS110 family transposase [Acetobacteraceae bacterium]HUB11359.1 IS110 family transposase [Acetobacteraceae bacterium]